MPETTKQMTNTNNKGNYFDLPESERRKIVLKAGKEAQKMMQKTIDDANQKGINKGREPLYVCKYCGPVYTGELHNPDHDVNYKPNPTRKERKEETCPKCGCANICPCHFDEGRGGCVGCDFPYCDYYDTNKPEWENKIHDWLLEDYDLRQEQEDGLKELVHSLLSQQKQELLGKITELKREPQTLEAVMVIDEIISMIQEEE